MIGLLQRVQEARVTVQDEIVGAIGRGLLVLVGVERGDDEAKAQRLLERLVSYRVFPDGQGRMNLNVQDVNGSLLLVPQFTLAADTRKGNRPSFTPAAAPEEGERLFGYLVAQARLEHLPVAAGQFGANMQVSLIRESLGIDSASTTVFIRSSRIGRRAPPKSLSAATWRYTPPSLDSAGRQSGHKGNGYNRVPC